MKASRAGSMSSRRNACCSSSACRSRLAASSSRWSRPARISSASSSWVARVSAISTSSSWSRPSTLRACSLGQLGQRLAIAAQQLAAIGRAGAERVQAFVVPARQHVLRAVVHGQDMDGDVVLLADAVESADALFQQVRIQRQVPQDQPMGELEVAPFRADLRAQQQARAVGLGKVRGVAVALDDAEAFVEARDADAAARAQRFLQRQHLGLAAADQQELVLRVLLQQVDQRCDARVVAVVQLDQRRRLLDVGMEFGQQRLAGAFVQRVGIEQVPLGHALRESRRCRRGGCGTSRGRCRGGRSARPALARAWAGLIVSASCAVSSASPCKASASMAALQVIQRLALEQPVGDLRQRLEGIGLGQVTVEVADSAADRAGAGGRSGRCGPAVPAWR